MLDGVQLGALGSEEVAEQAELVAQLERRRAGDVGEQQVRNVPVDGGVELALLCEERGLGQQRRLRWLGDGHRDVGAAAARLQPLEHHAQMETAAEDAADAPREAGEARPCHVRVAAEEEELAAAREEGGGVGHADHLLERRQSSDLERRLRVRLAGLPAQQPRLVGPPYVGHAGGGERGRVVVGGGDRECERAGWAQANLARDRMMYGLVEATLGEGELVLGEGTAEATTLGASAREEHARLGSDDHEAGVLLRRLDAAKDHLRHAHAHERLHRPRRRRVLVGAVA